MPRTKVKTAKEIKSWDEVNEALRQIAELDAGVKIRVSEYNEEEAKRRKAVDDHCNPLRKQIEEIETGMQNFCVANRPDFGDRKSKEFPNGRVDFRLGTPKVVKAAGFTWKAILDVVRASRYKGQFIRIAEDVDKEAVLAYHASTKGAKEDLAEVYLDVVQEETFGYEARVSIDEAT